MVDKELLRNLLKAILDLVEAQNEERKHDELSEEEYDAEDEEELL